MNEGYFEWLLNKAEIDKEKYRLLCDILYNSIFYPILEMDENRWEDGVAYRFSFAGSDEGAYDLGQAIGGCTMLELILSQAEKTHFDMQGSEFGAPIGKWFMEILSNMGLDIYTNSVLMNEPDAYYEVSDIIRRVIFRQYEYDGFGGMYPLNVRPEQDQREVEIEIQRNLYLLENYDIFGGVRNGNY